MRTGDHCRSCVVCRLRVRVHTHPSPASTFGFFRNSAPSVCPFFPSQFPTNQYPNKCLSLPSLVALPGVQLPAQPAPSLLTLLQKSGRQNAKPSSTMLKVRDVPLHLPKSRVYPISVQTPQTFGVRSATTAVSPQASGLLPVPNMIFELTWTKQSWLVTSGCRRLRVNTLSTRNTSWPRTMATYPSLPAMIT